jgi:Holliday junction resolvase RusA-like endonuclease
MGAVRMTRKGKYKDEAAQRYLSYKQAIQWQIAVQNKEETIFENPVEVDVVFFMPIPKSWSKPKRMRHAFTPHKTKPDIDNILKGLFDALNGLIWKDDNIVAKVSATKVYTPFKEGIQVKVKEMDKEWTFSD